MDIWIIVSYLFGVVCGGMIVFLICRKTMKEHKKAAQAYFNMYIESAEILADLVVSDGDLDEFGRNNG